MKKDMSKAISLLESSLAKGPESIRTDYVETLISNGTAKSKKTAFDYVKSLLKEKKGEVYIRMACMYRDGIGTKKDLGQAEAYIRKAIEVKHPGSYN